MIKKIGFVAACIDLHEWRIVIDDVLRDVEAENEEWERSRTRQVPLDVAA